MGSKWVNTTIGDILTLQRGHDLPSQNRSDGNVPIMGSSGLTGYHNVSKAKGPGVVVGRSGNSMGVVSFTPRDYWPLNTCLYVTDFKGNDERFIYYYLQGIDFDQFNSGSAQKSLNRNFIYPYQIKFPNSLSEQRAISGMLASLEEKIELNRQMNETLEQMAHALFKSWFVDFDPVIDNALDAGNPIPEELEARAEQRRQLRNAVAQGEASASGLPDEIRSLFPSEFQLTDEMGWIPKGWFIQPLSSIASLKTKSAHPSKNPEKLWSHFSIPAFDENKYPANDYGHEIKSGKYKVYKDMVLASKLNPDTPRVWLPEVFDESATVCSTEFMPFLPLKGEGREFLYALLSSEPVQVEICNRVTGSTGSRQRVKPKEIEMMSVLTPGSELRGIFSTHSKHLYQRVHVGLEGNNTLVKTRDYLLPKLISGELQIPDAEQQIAEVMS